MQIFFSPEVSLAFPKTFTHAFSTKSSLIVLGILYSILWTDRSLKPFLIGPSLCWTCMRVFTASISEKMENRSAGGPGWQVSGVSGRQAGGGSSIFASQKLNE